MDPVTLGVSLLAEDYRRFLQARDFDCDHRRLELPRGAVAPHRASCSLPGISATRCKERRPDPHCHRARSHWQRLPTPRFHFATCCPATRRLELEARHRALKPTLLPGGWSRSVSPHDSIAAGLHRQANSDVCRSPGSSRGLHGRPCQRTR